MTFHSLSTQQSRACVFLKEEISVLQQVKRYGPSSEILIIFMNKTPHFSGEALGLPLGDIIPFHADQRHGHLQGHAGQPSSKQNSHHGLRGL